MASGWRIRWQRQPGGRTVIEVSDQDGTLAGLVASSSLPLVSVDGGWRGSSRGPGRGRQRWALAIGHAAGGAVAVTFTRRWPGRQRTGCTTVHPAVVDGLWVAAVAGRYTAAWCHTPAATSALRLAPVAVRPRQAVATADPTRPLARWCGGSRTRP
jgi:hypothetical protein